MFVCVYNYLRLYYHAEYQDDDVHVAFVDIIEYSVGLSFVTGYLIFNDVLVLTRMHRLTAFTAQQGLVSVPQVDRLSPPRNKIIRINVDECMNWLV